MPSKRVMTVSPSPSVNTPNWGGGPALAFRLRPGAWRNGTAGLSTTLSRPRGLERSAITRAWGTWRARLRPLYGEGRGAIQSPGQANGTVSARAASSPAGHLEPGPAKAITAAAASPRPPNALR